VDRSALLALAEGWETEASEMDEVMAGERARLRAGKPSRYMLGFMAAVQAAHRTCAADLRRLLDAPHGPGGGEREAGEEKAAVVAGDPDREALGREVHEVYQAWRGAGGARLTWEKLDEEMREHDRMVGERLYGMGVAAARGEKAPDAGSCAADLEQARRDLAFERSEADRLRKRVAELEEEAWRSAREAKRGARREAQVEIDRLGKAHERACERVAREQGAAEMRERAAVAIDSMADVDLGTGSVTVERAAAVALIRALPLSADAPAETVDRVVREGLDVARVEVPRPKPATPNPGVSEVHADAPMALDAGGGP
jgi:hypothetical protein